MLLLCLGLVCCRKMENLQDLEYKVYRAEGAFWELNVENKVGSRSLLCIVLEGTKRSIRAFHVKL